MNNFLRQDDVQLVETKIKQFESATGCELLMVVANNSDPYPGASWRFGLMAGFLISLAFSYYWELHHSYLYPIFFLIVTLVMTWVGHFPWAKRCALSSWEVKRECEEKAIELFHSLGTSKVSHKVTAMIMISTFEKNIQVLVDEKLKEQITQAELDELVQIMTKHFREGNMGLGLVQSIQNLENKILKDFGGKVSEVHPSQLSDTIHFI